MVHDQSSCVRIGEVIGDLVALEQHVQRNHWRSSGVTPEVAHRELGHVGEQERDVLAGLDIQTFQYSREPQAELVQLGIVDPPIAAEDRGGGGPALAAQARGTTDRR